MHIMKQRLSTTIKEPSVIARVIKRTPFEALSSDGTLAAAVMVAAALCAVMPACIMRLLKAWAFGSPIFMCL